MIVGIDIGGSHITAALIDDKTIKIVPGSLVRYHVDSQGAADDILDTWSKTVQQIWAANGLDHSNIGIAMPGPFDYEEGISQITGTEKYEALYGMNVREPLARRLGINASQIRFRNDAEAFLLGEMMAGAGLGYQHAIGITLGTGLGSTVHHDGVTKDAARWCQTLYNGIAEDFISTRFFTRRYEALTGNAVKDARELAERVDGDAVAAQVFREFCQHLSLFLNGFIRDEQPQVIVVGGNIAKAWAIIYPELQQLMANELQTVAIKRAVLGEEAALIGGACAWL